MKALSLFSGIGGLDLAAQMAGIETEAFCEIEPFAVQVLNKRFPNLPVFPDVKQLTGGVLGGTTDVIHGGFPCQDLSVAGKQAGLEGARSGLWFEMLRVISEVRPRYVLAENVRGAVNLALDTVYSGLVGAGYEVWSYVIPASAVGASHQRERLFVVGVREDVANAYCERYLHRQSAINPTEARKHAQCDVTTSGNLWPTPTACGNNNRKGINQKSGDGLATAVKLWPTPVKEDYRRRGPNSKQQGLPEVIYKVWPTPREFMYKDSLTDRGKSNIGEVVGGQLNPDWVEQLMGYPEGWTDLDVDVPRPWQGWPALLGQEQYPYEFSRTTTGCKNRAKRLKALGNSVVPQQAYPFFKLFTEIEKILRGNSYEQAYNED